jgi:hypothetical protein
LKFLHLPFLEMFTGVACNDTRKILTCQQINQTLA